MPRLSAHSQDDETVPEGSNPEFPRLAGTKEIANLAHVSVQAVCNWRIRHPDFPEPVAELEMGPVFLFDEVEEWVGAHKQKVVDSHMRVFVDGVEVRR